jgi:hypothetical protein
MAKPKPQVNPPQSSSENDPAANPIDQLTVDQAFQRLLEHFGKPNLACDHLDQAVRAGEVILWGREAGASWFRTRPVYFKQQLLIEADERPDGWHASIEVQAGKIGIKDFELYEWAFASSEIDALCMADRTDKSPAGAKRGPKEKYDWELFKAQFYLFLYDDDVPPGADINIEQRANDLIEWGSEHPEIGEEKTPSTTRMREKVAEWTPLWKRLRACNR